VLLKLGAVALIWNFPLSREDIADVARRIAAKG
jgi:hypothetical protein